MLITPRRRLPLLATLLLIAGLAVIPASTVRAQGTDGAVPDPITMAELGLYADRLGLSEQQRMAIDRMHERYSEAFRALRDGEIQQFLDTSRRMFTSFMFNPDTEAAQQMLNQYTRLDARVKAIDDAFFDEMQSVLTREQARAIERVRQMRERLRYRSGVNRIVSFANPGVSVDVSGLLQGIELSEDSVQRVDSTLQNYEMQVTARLRRFNDATGRMMVEMVAALEEMMGGIDMQQNPRQMMARFEQMQTVMSDVARPALDEATEVVQINRRAVRNLVDMLPADEGRRLEYAFLRAAYPRVFEGIWQSMGLYELALARYADDGVLRGRIEDLRDAMDSRHRPLSEQMMDVWDAQRREMPAMPMGPRGRRGGTGPEDDRLERLGERRDRINEQGIEALLSVLGMRSTDELTDRGAAPPPPTVQTAPRGQRAPRAIGARRFATSVAFADALRPAPGADDLLPGPIDDAEFRWYVEMLGIDAVDAAIAQSVYRQYLEEFRAVEEQRVREFTNRIGSAWSFGADGGFTAPSDSEIEMSYRERAELLETLLDIDDAFFDDLALLLPDDAAERLEMAQRARLRTVYNRTADGAGPGRGGGPLTAFRQGMRGGMGMNTGGREDSIDLLRLLEHSELSQAERDRLRMELRSYEAALTEAMRTRYEVLVNANRSAELLAAAAASAQQGGGRFDWSVMMRGDIQTRMEEMTRQTAEARNRIVELNRQAIEGLGDRGGVRELYRRAAFPSIYRDPDNAEGSLLAALELDGLSFDQRERIGDLLMDFRAPYNDLSERMIVLEADEQVDDGDRMARWQRRQGQRSEMQRLRFERSELSERTIRRLIAILDDQQRDRLGLSGG